MIARAGTLCVLLVCGCARDPSPPSPAASASDRGATVAPGTTAAASAQEPAASAPAPVPLAKPIQCKVASDTGSAGSFDNESICKAMAPKANAGTATLQELKMLRAACSALGDKDCRDGAAAAIQRLGDRAP